MATLAFKQRNTNLVDTRVIDIYDSSDEFYGKFTVKYRDPHSPATKFAFNKALNALSEADYKRATEPKTVDDQAFSTLFDTRFFVENYVTDSDVPLTDGAKWKHNAADLIEYFMLDGNGFILPQLQSAASNANNFRKAKEDAAKNA